MLRHLLIAVLLICALLEGVKCQNEDRNGENQKHRPKFSNTILDNSANGNSAQGNSAHGNFVEGTEYSNEVDALQNTTVNVDNVNFGNSVHTNSAHGNLAHGNFVEGTEYSNEVDALQNTTVYVDNENFGNSVHSNSALDNSVHGNSVEDTKYSNEVDALQKTTVNVVSFLDKRHTCQIFGDSHITTFDNKRYSVWGTTDCSYIFALDCYYASWMIYVKFTDCGDVSKSVSSILIYKNLALVMLSRGWQVHDRDGEVRMEEGRSRHLGSGMFVKLTGVHIRVDFEGSEYDKVSLFWDGWNTVTLRTEAASICGLCGDNNGDERDDFVNIWFHGEAVIRSTSTFVASWAADSDRSCWAKDQNKTTCSTHKQACERVMLSSIFEEQCVHSDITYYLDMCIEDSCHKMDLDSEYSLECQTANSLVSLCESRGGSLRGWQEKVGCPDSCSVKFGVFSTGCALSYNPWRGACPQITY